MTVCVVSSSRTPTATSCSSVVLAKTVMRPRFLLLFIILVLEGRYASAPSDDAVRSEVLSTDDARIRARTTGDVLTLSPIYADDYSLVTAEGALRTKKDQTSELQSGQLQF